MPWEIAIAFFGIAAAFLLVGGGILLRYQRDRQHFLLMQAALDKGITTFPGMVPGWLVSLRVGVLALVLGLGLIAAGVAIHQAARFVDEPPQEAAQPAASSTMPAPAPPRDGSPEERRPPPPPAPLMERWHRIQAHHAAGLVAICVGAILVLLGIVRIAFARMERRYTSETSIPPPSMKRNSP